MSTQKFYDKVVAKNYSSNPFNQCIFEETFTELLSKSLTIHNESLSAPKVLDVGCGDAGFLKLFNQQVPDAVLTGIDISSVMMQKGQEDIGFLSIHMDAVKGLKSLILLGVKFDFIVLSFVSAYLDLNELLPLIKQLLAPKGLVLYQASLKHSFPSITQEVYTQYQRSKNPLRKYITQQFKQGRDSTYLYNSIDDITNLFVNNQMQAVNQYIKTIDLEFKSLKQWLAFIRDGGWATPYMSGVYYPLIYSFLALKVYHYPKHEQAIIGCVIACSENNT